MKLDFGCGKSPKEGFDGVDVIDFGQPHKIDLRSPWPWENESVDEVYSSHFIEHLTAEERIHFFNELGRVLKQGAKATIIAPHVSNVCAYGDPTHKWPPVSEWLFLYLNKAWREQNAPHVALTCDFDSVYGPSIDQRLSVRAQDYQQFAVQNYWNAIRDIHATLTKK